MKRIMTAIVVGIMLVFTGSILPASATKTPIEADPILNSFADRFTGDMANEATASSERLGSDRLLKDAYTVGKMRRRGERSADRELL